MGLFKWLKQTSPGGSDSAEELTPEEIVAAIESRQSFAAEVEIGAYANLFQECYESLLRSFGEGAPVLGAWSEAELECANCGQAFPGSFKLHLTNPQLFPGLHARSDCPDCGSAFMRICYSPPVD